MRFARVTETRRDEPIVSMKLPLALTLWPVFVEIEDLSGERAREYNHNLSYEKPIVDPGN